MCDRRWVQQSRRRAPVQHHSEDRRQMGPIATKFRGAAKRCDVPQAKVKRHASPLRRWTISFSHCWMKSRITAMARSGASGTAGNKETIRKNEVRRQRCNDVAVSPLARIPDRFSQHGVKLALAEFLRLLPYCLPRYLLCHRAGTGGQQRRPSLRHRPYPGFCCWRLVTTLQAQAS